jgi:hypothetical protein
MAAKALRPEGRLLDPMERISEVLFGLIMVLTVTCSLSVEAKHRGPGEVRELLIGALGCNFAWGIVDAVMYLMTKFSQRGQTILTFRAVHRVADPEKARVIIAEALPPLLAQVLSSSDFETIHAKLMSLPEPRSSRLLTARDWLAAFAVFSWVFLSTLPVLAPFVITRNAALAIRVSNAIALVLLFVTGYALGGNAGRSPWKAGIVVVAVGGVLVVIAIALGG